MLRRPLLYNNNVPGIEVKISDDSLLGAGCYDARRGGGGCSGIPGASLIVGAIAIWGVAHGFSGLGRPLGTAVAVLLLSVGIDFQATYWGAKQAGASKWGQIGAIVGLVVGFLGLLRALPQAPAGDSAGAAAGSDCRRVPVPARLEGGAESRCGDCAGNGCGKFDSGGVGDCDSGCFPVGDASRRCWGG